MGVGHSGLYLISGVGGVGLRRGNQQWCTRTTLWQVNYCVVLQARTVVPRFYGTAKKTAPVEPSINKNQVILSRNRKLTTSSSKIAIWLYFWTIRNHQSMICQYMSDDRGTEVHIYRTSHVAESASRTSIQVHCVP